MYISNDHFVMQCFDIVGLAGKIRPRNDRCYCVDDWHVKSNSPIVLKLCHRDYRGNLWTSLFAGISTEKQRC